MILQSLLGIPAFAQGCGLPRRFPFKNDPPGRRCRDRAVVPSVRHPTDACTVPIPLYHRPVADINRRRLPGCNRKWDSIFGEIRTRGCVAQRL